MKSLFFILFILLYVQTFGQKPITIKKETLDSIAPYVKLVEEPWIFASESNDHKKFYIRKSYVTKTDEEIKIWIKITYPTYTFNKKTYKHAYKLVLCTFDLINRKMKVTSETNYTFSGNVITAFDTGAKEWSDIVVDSVFESVFEKVEEVFVN